MDLHLMELKDVYLINYGFLWDNFFMVFLKEISRNFENIEADLVIFYYTYFL